MTTITNLSTNAIRPGTEFVINGEGLDGLVFLAIPGAPVTELPVLSSIGSGSSTSPSSIVSLTVKVPDDLSGLPSSSGASVFVAGSNGNSNDAAITFNAVILYFLSFFYDEQAGGIFGARKDAVAGGGALGPNQELIEVVIRQKDGGQAYLQDPAATPNDLRQGYHIGTPAAQGTRMRLYYQVRAPRGFEPNPIPGCTAWEVSAEIPWVTAW